MTEVHGKLSAGIVIVRETAEGPNYLLLRAFRYWDFPKGHVEPDETPLDAACREVAEETSLTSLDFVWGHCFCDTPRYARGKVARYFLARTDQCQVQIIPNPQTGRREHMEYRWVSYDDACKLVSPRVRRILDWADTTMKTA